jgi:hypothetical protein
MPSRLAAAWIAAILALLALAATASAAVLPPNGFDGTKLDGYANGVGQVNLDWDHSNSFTGANSRFFFDSVAGGINQGNADAGLNIGLYDADGLGHSAVYGFRGTPMVSVNSPTPVIAAGTGTGGDPYKLTSRYTTGDCTQEVRCLQVTETVQFVNGDSSALLTWDVANISADGQPAQFRATFGADSIMGGDEGGMGRYTPSAPRLVGTINQKSGAGVELQESLGGGSPAWTAWQEDVPFQIWRQVQNPDTGGLTGDVSQPYSDKAAAVQWDTYKTSGLALCPALARPACAGSTAHFELRVFYRSWEPLVVTDPADPPTHTQVSVPVTARNDDGTFTDLTAAPMYYRTRPTSPNVLTPNNTWLQASQTTLGQATIQYTGDNPGTDVLEVWVDTDNDGVVDANEPFRTDNIFWYDRTAISSLYTSSPRVGFDDRANLRFVNGSNAVEARNFQYKVVDKATAADRIPLSAVLTTSATDGNYHDPVKPAGEPGIHFTRNTPGTDIVYVYSDLDSDGDYTDPGEVATREVTWTNRIDTSGPSYLYTNTDSTLRAYPYTTTGSTDSLTQLRYWVTDKGVDGADQAAPTLTGAYTTFPLTRADNDPGQVVYHIYLDTNVNQVYDAGVDPIQNVTIDWILSPTNRFTIDTTNSNGTIGYSKPLDVTILKDDGTPDTSQHVRYRITSGINPLAETAAANTNGSGKTTINVPASASEGFDTVFMYADTNNNQKLDDNEPQASRSVDWVPAIQIYAYDTHVPEQADATVYFRDAHGDLVDPGSYTYSVAGAHNIAATAGPAAPNGYGFISWPASSSTVTGADTITINAPSLPTAPKTNAVQIDFVDQVDLYPAQTTLTVGQTANIDYDLYSFSSSGTWTYTVTGANPQSGSVSYPTNISYVGVNAGDDTITVTSPDGLWSSTTHIHWNGEALSLSGPTDTTQGAGITLTAHARDSVTGADAPGTTLRWTIGGANPKGGKNAALTDSGGELGISWLGLKSGFDTITVYADINNDGVRQNPAEPQKTFQVHVHPVLEPDDTSDVLYQGASKTVTVTYRNLSYTPISGTQLKYEIIDQGVSFHAGNPQPVTPMPTTTNGSGQASITWTGVHTGWDRLKVWDDLNDNDVIDVNEPVATTDVEWDSRVVLSPHGNQVRNVNQGTLNAVATLRDTAGARLAGTQVRYTLTGVGSDGGTVHSATTDSLGQVTIPMTSTDGGPEVLTVWQDLGTADGVLDEAVGEPNDVLNLQWQATIAISNNFQTLYQGATHQTLAISGNPVLSGANVRVTYSGPNARAAEQYPSVSGTQNLPNLTGNVPGTDTVHAWVDTNNDGVQNAGEAGASATLKWLPRVSLGQPTGSLEAGQQTTVVAKLLDTSGTAIAGTLKYKVTGANSVGPTSYAVDSSGAPSITYTGVNNGSDTLTVWEDTDANGAVDPGEARNSMTISWKAPGVVLTPLQTSDEKFQGATSSLVVRLTNNPASSGGNSGRTIRWSVSGANSDSGTATTNGSGDATIAYKGTNDGTDTVTAYADVSGSTGTKDGFDPSASMTMTWDSAVQISGGPSEDSIGGSHSETVRFVDSLGNPLVNALVIYQISGANPTNGQVLARPVASDSGTRLNARTDGSGNATVTWTGSNPAGGTDTLDVWADADNSNTVTAGDPHAAKTVTWRTASAASSPGTGTTTPIGTISQVTPGSANDFDGLPTPPPPVVAKSVNVEPVSGRVFVRLPGKKNFIELLDAEQIPVGSIVDVRKGRVALTSAQNLTGGVATAQFYSGQFQIAQKKAAKPITDLVLYGGSFKACGKLARKSDAGGVAAQKKKIRQLWGSGKGSFRTKGKYGSAAIRGTTWDVVDYCDGTLVKVTEGIVTVHDNGKNRNITLKAKKTYFAKAKSAKAGRKRR